MAVLLMMPLKEDAATDIAREESGVELILMILVIATGDTDDGCCWGEQGE